MAVEDEAKAEPGRGFTALLFWLPLGSNGFVLLAALIDKHDQFARVGLDYAVTVFCAVGSLISLGGFFLRELPLGRTMVGCVIQAAFLIAIFACFYRNVGLIDFKGSSEIETLWSGLYFSIVTWTTLGYGDLHPTAPLRLVAAAEAILGYIFSGILIGLLVAQLERLRER